MKSPLVRHCSQSVWVLRQVEVAQEGFNGAPGFEAVGIEFKIHSSSGRAENG